MSMSIASLNSNMALSVYNAQINLLTIALVIFAPARALRKYMPDEPGGFDPKKNRPAFHLKRPRHRKIVKPNFPMVNRTLDRVTKLVGTSAIMKCEAGLSNVTINWYHWPNSTYDVWISTNFSTIVEDKRYLVKTDAEQKIWSMKIRYVKIDDAGVYECRVLGEPQFSIRIPLVVYEAKAVILGRSLREVDRGFPIRLSCIINSTSAYKMEPPEYMFWYHGNRVINYDLKDGAVVRQGRLATELIFQRASPEHSGNYSCVPSNARQASVEVKVHYPGEELPNTFEAWQSKQASLEICPLLTLLLLGMLSSVYR